MRVDRADGDTRHVVDAQHHCFRRCIQFPPGDECARVQPGVIAVVRRLEIHDDPDVRGIGPRSRVAGIDVASVRGLKHESLLDLDGLVGERELEVERTGCHRACQLRTLDRAFEPDSHTSHPVLRPADLGDSIEGDLDRENQAPGLRARDPLRHPTVPSRVGNQRALRALRLRGMSAERSTPRLRARPELRSTFSLRAPYQTGDPVSAAVARLVQAQPHRRPPTLPRPRARCIAPAQCPAAISRGHCARSNQCSSRTSRCAGRRRSLSTRHDAPRFVWPDPRRSAKRACARARALGPPTPERDSCLRAAPQRAPPRRSPRGSTP